MSGSTRPPAPVSFRPDDLLGIDRQLVLKRGKYRCAYCGRRLSPRRFHVDHRLPPERGGSDAQENLVPACGRCNASKGQRTDGEFPPESGA